MEFVVSRDEAAVGREHVEGVVEIVAAIWAFIGAHRAGEERRMARGELAHLYQRYGLAGEDERRRGFRPDDVGGPFMAVNTAEIDQPLPIAQSELRKIFFVLRHIGLNDAQANACDR